MTSGFGDRRLAGPGLDIVTDPWCSRGYAFLLPDRPHEVFCHPRDYKLLQIELTGFSYARKSSMRGLIRLAERAQAAGRHWPEPSFDALVQQTEGIP